MTPDTEPLRAIRARVRSLATIHHVRVLAGHPAIRELPLLAQLRAAIGSSMGSMGVSASLPSDRTPLNMGAFKLYEDISDEIAGIYEAATERPRQGMPELNLSDWFAEFSAAYFRAEIIPLQITVAQRRLVSWTSRIRDLLDPPPGVEIAAACPRCGSRHVALDSEVLPALAGRWPREGGVPSVYCRVCRETWVGESELLALADEIEGANVKDPPFLVE